MLNHFTVIYQWLLEIIGRRFLPWLIKIKQKCFYLWVIKIRDHFIYDKNHVYMYDWSNHRKMVYLRLIRFIVMTSYLTDQIKEKWFYLWLIRVIAMISYLTDQNQRDNFIYKWSNSERDGLSKTVQNHRSFYLWSKSCFCLHIYLIKENGFICDWSKSEMVSSMIE